MRVFQFDKPHLLSPWTPLDRNRSSRLKELKVKDRQGERIEEISINYVDTGEIYNRETTVVDIYFAKKIAKIIDLDPEPKSMAECKQHLD